MKPEEAIEIVQAIKFIDDFEDYSDRLEIALDMAIEALKEQRPHGVWKKKPEICYDYFYCSECGYAYKHAFNFCPNCGASMKEGDENG